MPDRVAVEIQAGVALVRIDNPPVNALSREVSAELAAAVERLASDAAVQALVIVGAGRTFVAGADVRDLEAAAWTGAEPPDFHGLLALVEDCAKPVVMAVHGNALGGGLELAMAGHYRLAAPGARLGLPEVNLGIVPGAEGTQRLPRLVGLGKAVEMCVTGKPIDAFDALRSGLVDRLVEGDLAKGAVAFAREVVGRAAPLRRTRERAVSGASPAEREAALEHGRALARRTRRNQTAPLAVLEALEAAATLPFDAGCRRERALSGASVRSEQGRALVHAFFAERGVARVPGIPRDAATRDVATVAVVGAGTMGAGIAMACANAGLRVSLADVDKAAVERGLATIRRNYQSSIDRGRLTAEAVAERLARIEPGTGYDGCAAADLVIEAVFESLELKRTVFAEIDRRAPSGAILASNTSTLDIDAIAGATGRPEAVVGLHFFSPAHVMRLVEVVRGAATGGGVLAASLAFARRLSKVGVVVRNAAGFVGNRMMFPYMYEAQFLVEEGATPEQVDRVLTDFGMAMGIFAVDDLGGLDVAWRIRREQRQFEGAARSPLVADRLVESGRLGQKTGRGWFRYGDDRKPIPDPEVVALIEQTARAAGIKRRAVSDSEILERTVYALVNEGARALDEGVALRAADVDVIYLTGYGFPGYRGGPMYHADAMGLRVLYERLRSLEREHGVRFAPAPLLVRLAEAGSSFRAWDQSREPDEAP